LDLRTARERLFAVPLDSFVETRAELVAELTQQGQKDDSKKLKGIRRPTLSAWATNQIVRCAPDDVSTFFEASDELRRVQHAMLHGQSERAAYQTAAEAFRTATTMLGATIRRTLDAGGRNIEPPLVERILSNFRVATVSGERRAELLSGQLENDVTAGDDDLAGVLGATAGGAGTSDIPQGVPAKEIPAKAAGNADARREQLEQAKRAREEIARVQAEEARRRLEVARSEEAAAIARATEAEAHAVRSRTVCDQARERLGEADRTAAQAREAWRDAQLIAQRADREAAEARAQRESAVQRRETVERRSG